MTDVAKPEERDALSVVSRDLIIRASGQKSPSALDSEINILGYFSPMSNQQILLAKQSIGNGWRITAAAVGGVEFRECLLAREGELTLPRIQGSVLAAISHPWSGIVEIETEQGIRQVDLYSAAPRAVVIDTGNGLVRDVDPKDILVFREMFKDALTSPDLIDQRETHDGRRSSVALPVVVEEGIGDIPDQQALGWISLRATERPSNTSTDTLVTITEIEPMAGMFVELSRLDRVDGWNLETRSSTGTAKQVVLTSSYGGKLRLQAARSGSVAFLCGPDSGIVELDIFGTLRQVNLFSNKPKLLRINFEGRLPLHGGSAVSPESEATRQRSEFYTAMLMRIDRSQPLGLYVPRWKGVAASTKNLLTQTLPFPHTSDGHPADVTPEDVKFLANTLLASGVRHFVVSGGDTFWINAIRRIQREEPGIRFDLIWHSNYLQMGEPHDWNLLKNWLRAIADGLVTRVAVVKEGLELLFRKVGVDAVFIPNVIRSDPSEITYNGARELVGIWLSGSSAYRKVPYAVLLALKAVKGIRLIGAGFDDDSLAIATELRLPREDIWREPLPQVALHQNIQRTSLTLYITLSECSPMLPLESMHLGVPSLVGPCSHLFRTDPYLYKMLVVENPLSQEAIARHTRGVLTEGQRIIEAFVEYSHGEQKQAADGLARFLS